MTAKQQKALAALVRAPTLEAAATAAGVGYSTLRRWLKEDEVFRRAYSEAVAELLEDASIQAKRSLSQALDVLQEVMTDGDENAQARITAARSMLEYGLKLHDAAEVEKRLQELERMLKEVEA